jgi:hypothetical protein
MDFAHRRKRIRHMHQRIGEDEGADFTGRNESL